MANEVEIRVTASNDTDLGFSSALRAVGRLRGEVKLLQKDLNDLTANVKINMERSLGSVARAASGGGGGGSDRGIISRFIGGAVRSYSGGEGKSGWAGITGGFLKNLLGGLVGGGAAGGLGMAGAAGGGLASAIGVTGSLAALIASLPFLGAAAATGLVAAFGGGLSAIGIVAAMKLKPVQGAFHDVKVAWDRTVRGMADAFAPAMTAIGYALHNTIKALRPALEGFAYTVAPALQTFGTTIAKSLGSPAVQEAISQLGAAFALFLKDMTPQMPGIIKAFADGLSGMAQAFTAHPNFVRGLTDVLGFLLRLPGYALGALGSLMRVANWLITGFPHDVSIGLDHARTDIVHWADNTYEAIMNWNKRASKAWNDFWHGVAHDWDTFRHTMAASYDEFWKNTIGATIHGIGDLVKWYDGIPHRILDAFKGIGSALWSMGHFMFTELWNGLKSISGGLLGWIGNFIKSIPSLFLKLLHISSPSAVFYDIGRNIMLGLEHGVKSRAGSVKSSFHGLIPAMTGALSGNAAVAQSFAASILPRGWSFGDLLALWNRESGWNAYAVNPSSGAYGIPQSLGHGHPYNLGDYKAQIVWGLNYIASRYGDSQNAWAHETAFGWYDRGGWLPPGLSLALNTTGKPERVGGGGGPIVIEFHGTGTMEKAFLDLMQKMVQTYGGGDVQRAFGLANY